MSNNVGSAEFKYTIAADAANVSGAVRDLERLQRAIQDVIDTMARMRGPDLNPGFGMQFGPRSINAQEASAADVIERQSMQAGASRARGTSLLPRGGRLQSHYAADQALKAAEARMKKDLEATATMAATGQYQSSFAGRPNMDSELRTMRAAVTMMRSTLESARTPEDETKITEEMQHAVEAQLNQVENLHNEFSDMALHGSNATAAGRDQLRRNRARLNQQRQTVRENAPYYGRYFTVGAAAGGLTTAENQLLVARRKLQVETDLDPKRAAELYQTKAGTPLLAEMDRLLQSVAATRDNIENNRSALNPMTVTSSFQQEIGDLIKEMRDLRDTFRDQNQTAKTAATQAKEAEREANAPRRLQAQQIADENLARNIDKRSFFGRASRGLSWLMPPEGYMLSGAMDAIGVPFKAALAAQIALMGAMVTQQIFDAHAVMMGQNYQIAAISGISPSASGYTPNPYGASSAQTAQNLRFLGLSYGVGQSDLFKALPAFNDYNISNPNTIEKLTNVALAQSTFSGTDLATSMKTIGEIVQRLGMSTQQATQQMADFDAAIMATHANAQVATQDLGKFADMLPPGATGLQDIAGFTKFAGEFGMTGAQMFGPTLGATGNQRIQMAALLGMTPDQYMEAQKTAAGRKDIAQREMKYAQALYAQTGNKFTVTESILQGLGFMPQGVDPDVMMNALLGGRNGQSLLELLAQSNVTSPTSPGMWESTMAGAARGMLQLGQMKDLAMQGGMNILGGLMIPAGPGFTSPFQNAMGLFAGNAGADPISLLASGIYNLSRATGLGGGRAGDNGNFWSNPNITINLFDAGGQLRGTATATPTPGTTTSTTRTVSTVLPNSPPSGWDANRR